MLRYVAVACLNLLQTVNLFNIVLFTSQVYGRLWGTSRLTTARVRVGSYSTYVTMITGKRQQEGDIIDWLVISAEQRTDKTRT